MYDFKQTQRVIDGVKYAVTLGEGEIAYIVRVSKDDATIETYTQCKDKQTCLHHRNCGEKWGMMLMGETMNTARDLYEQFSHRLLAM